MANPINMEWTGPTEYVDGKPYGQADHGGYDVEVNGAVAFSVPVAWNAANVYTFPIVNLPGLKQGSNTVRLRTVAANGAVSEFTPPVNFTYASVPRAPTSLAAR